MSAKDVSDLLKNKFQDDPYAHKLGIELLELAPGYAKARMRTDDSHLNFLGFVHGGLIFSLLDYVFSAACNAHNQSAVAVSMSVQFLNAPEPGGVLVSEGREIEKSRRLGLYEMVVYDEAGRLICRSDGRVYRIGQPIVETGE